MPAPTTDSPVLRSLAGFIAALVIGALIPRTLTFLVRRVLVRSFREVVVLALAGWLTDRIVRWISSGNRSLSS